MRRLCGHAVELEVVHAKVTPGTELPSSHSYRRIISIVRKILLGIICRGHDFDAVAFSNGVITRQIATMPLTALWTESGINEILIPRSAAFTIKLSDLPFCRRNRPATRLVLFDRSENGIVYGLSCKRNRDNTAVLRIVGRLGHESHRVINEHY